MGPSLRWVLQESGEFPDLPAPDQLTPEQIVTLEGGVDAATYLVRCPSGDVEVTEEFIRGAVDRMAA